MLQQPGRVTAGVLVFLMKMRPPTSHHWLISGLKGIANISHHLCHTNILQLQHIYTQTTLHHLFRCESYSRITTVKYSYSCASQRHWCYFWIKSIFGSKIFFQDSLLRSKVKYFLLNLQNICCSTYKLLKSWEPEKQIESDFLVHCWNLIHRHIFCEFCVHILATIYHQCTLVMAGSWQGK